MDASKPKYAIQLKEHLQHQQDPFSLKDYLIERSYMFKNFNFDSSSIHPLYSTKNLRWSIKYDLHKKRKRIATGFLRTLLYKFIPPVDNQEFSNWDEEHNSDPYYVHEVTADTQIVDMFQSFTLPKLRRSEVDTGSKPYWISSKEPLPNAVCHLKSPDAPVIRLPIFSQKLGRDPVFSTYLGKLLVNSNILKFGRAKRDKLQRILQKREQLPFGCAEKDGVFHENEGKGDSIKAVPESEDLQCIIHEHFSLLEKQYRQVKKITHLLHTESCVTSQEWDNFQIVNREIHMEIGDAIMDDIVKEVIHLF